MTSSRSWDTDTGFRTRATDRYNGRDQAKGYNSSTYHSNVAVSYVTGSHTLMVGGQLPARASPPPTGSRTAASTTSSRPTCRRHPRAVGGHHARDAAESAEPGSTRSRCTPVDQWTIDRLTLNLGIRYTHFDGFVPDVIPAGRSVRPAAQTTSGWTTIVSWHDLTPRVGFAYDLFGNGRTAVKATFARYLIGHAGDVINRENPQVFVAENARRDLERPERQLRAGLRAARQGGTFRGRRRHSGRERRMRRDLERPVRRLSRALDVPGRSDAVRLAQPGRQLGDHRRGPARAGARRRARRGLLPPLVRQTS